LSRIAAVNARTSHCQRAFTRSHLGAKGARGNRWVRGFNGARGVGAQLAPTTAMSSDQTNTTIGIVLIGGGVVLTLASYAMTDNDHRYSIFIGALVVGAVRLFRSMGTSTRR
jgi:hypothetical protein